MDHENMADTAANHWDEDPAQRVEMYAANLAARAQGMGRKITHPGEGADMNAALVNAVRQSTLLEVHADLGYVANDVRKLTTQQAEEQARAAQSSARRAHQQGVEEGVQKGKEYHAHEVADAEARSLHGNPAMVREQERVIIPAGYVAAWFHVLEEPDGTKCQRQVFGRLAADVREGDTRAVIVAGPDRLLVGLDRIRFAPSLATIVAEADLKLLGHLEVLNGDQTAVRLRDSMDGQSRMDVTVETVTAEQVPEEAAPGTFIRLVTEGTERTVIDLSKEKWQQLVQAVETLYARRVLADAEGDEE